MTVLWGLESFTSFFSLRKKKGGVELPALWQSHLPIVLPPFSGPGKQILSPLNQKAPPKLGCRLILSDHATFSLCNPEFIIKACHQLQILVKVWAKGLCIKWWGLNNRRCPLIGHLNVGRCFI